MSSDAKNTNDPRARAESRDDHSGSTAAASVIEASSTSDSSNRLEKLDSRVIQADKLKDPFAHLPEDEREILKRQLDTPEVVASLKTLYRFATTMDYIIIAISAIAGIGGGSVMPLMTVWHLFTCCL